MRDRLKGSKGLEESQTTTGRQTSRRLANRIDKTLFGYGPSPSRIFHSPFAIFHLALEAKPKMENGRWQIRFLDRYSELCGNLARVRSKKPGAGSQNPKWLGCEVILASISRRIQVGYQGRSPWLTCNSSLSLLCRRRGRL